MTQLDKLKVNCYAIADSKRTLSPEVIGLNVRALSSNANVDWQLISGEASLITLTAYDTLDPFALLRLP